MRKTGLFFLLLGAFTTSFFGQEISTVYTQYTVEEGLPSNTVNYVMQDSKGYLWILGDKKAIRYNGREFKEIELNSLPILIKEDSKGRLWVGTIGQLLIIEDMKLKAPAPYYREIFKTLNRTFVHSLAEDEQGDMWYTVNNRVSDGDPCDYELITAYKIGKDSLETHNLDQDPGAYPFAKFGLLKPLANGNLIYTGKRFNSQAKYKREEKFKQLNNTFDLDLPLSHISVLKDKSLLSFTSWEILHSNKDSILYYAKAPFDANVRCVLEDHAGNIWIGTRAGLWMAPKGDFKSVQKIDKLPDYIFTSITQDSENNIWLGTEGSGLIKFSGNDLERIYWKDEIPANHIVDMKIYDGSLWISSNAGTLKRIDAQNKVEDIKVPKTGGGFALVTTESGLFTSHRWRVGKNGNSKLKTLIGREELHGEYFQILLPAGGNKVWASSNAGVIKFDVQTREVLYKADEKGFKAEAYSMTLDGEGRLWVLGNGNIFRMENDSIKNVEHLFPGLDSVRERQPFIEILVNADGHVILATFTSVIIYTPEGVQVLKRNRELTGSKKFFLNYLEEDKSLWITAFRGVDRFRYDPASKKYERDLSLGKNEGLPTQSFGQIISFNNKLYFGTADGVFIFNPESLSASSLLPPPVYVTGLENPDSLYAPSQDIKLKYSANNPVLHMDGISFQKREAITFHYRLIGDKSEWEKTKNLSVRYTNLKPGDYEFEVIGSRDEQRPDIEPQRFSFEIVPHFTQTWFFITGLTALAALLLGYAVYSYVRWKDRQDRRQMLTTELKYQALQSQMSPHFIFNAMNSISYLVKNKKSNEADKYLNKFAGLLRGVLENAQYSFITLLEEIELVQSYLELEQLQFGSQFQFFIDMDPELMAYELQIPPMLLQPIIENSIRHGISPRGQGMVKVDFKDQEKQLQISIEDDGVGRTFAEELKKNSLTHKSHTQVGLKNIRERIRVLNHLYSLNMEMSVLDLTEDGKAMGTRVVFTFPKIKYLPEIENSSFTSLQSFAEKSEKSEKKEGKRN